MTIFGISIVILGPFLGVIQILPSLINMLLITHQYKIIFKSLSLVFHLNIPFYYITIPKNFISVIKYDYNCKNHVGGILYIGFGKKSLSGGGLHGV